MNRDKKLAFQIVLVALYLFIKFDIIKFDWNCGYRFTKIQCCFVPNIVQSPSTFQKNITLYVVSCRGFIIFYCVETFLTWVDTINS